MADDAATLARVFATPHVMLQSLILLRDKLVKSQPAFAVEDSEQPVLTTPTDVQLARSHSAEALALETSKGDTTAVAAVAAAASSVVYGMSDMELLFAPAAGPSPPPPPTNIGKSAAVSTPPPPLSMNRRMGRTVVEVVRAAARRLSIMPQGMLPDRSVPDGTAGQSSSAGAFVVSNPTHRGLVRDCAAVLYEISQSILVHCNSCHALLGLLMQAPTMLLLIDIAEHHHHSVLQQQQQLQQQQSQPSSRSGGNGGGGGRRIAVELKKLRETVAQRPFNTHLGVKLIDAYCLEYLVDAAMPPSVCSARFEAVQTAAWQLKADFIVAVASLRNFSAGFVKVMPIQCIHNLVLFALHAEYKVRLRFFDRLIADGLLDAVLAALKVGSDAAVLPLPRHEASKLAPPAATVRAAPGSSAASSSRSLSRSRSTDGGVGQQRSRSRSLSAGSSNDLSRGNGGARGAEADVSVSSGESASAEDRRVAALQAASFAVDIMLLLSTPAAAAGSASSPQDGSSARSTRNSTKQQLPLADGGLGAGPAAADGDVFLVGNGENTVGYCVSWCTVPAAKLVLLEMLRFAAKCSSSSTGHAAAAVGPFQRLLLDKAAQAIAQCAAFSTGLFNLVVGVLVDGKDGASVDAVTQAFLSHTMPTLFAPNAERSAVMAARLAVPRQQCASLLAGRLRRDLESLAGLYASGASFAGPTAERRLAERRLAGYTSVVGRVYSTLLDVDDPTNDGTTSFDAPGDEPVPARKTRGGGNVRSRSEDALVAALSKHIIPILRDAACVASRGRGVAASAARAFLATCVDPTDGTPRRVSLSPASQHHMVPALSCHELPPVSFDSAALLLHPPAVVGPKETNDTTPHPSAAAPPTRLRRSSSSSSSSPPRHHAAALKGVPHVEAVVDLEMSPPSGFTAQSTRITRATSRRTSLVGAMLAAAGATVSDSHMARGRAAPTTDEVVRSTSARGGSRPLPPGGLSAERPSRPQPRKEVALSRPLPPPFLTSPSSAQPTVAVASTVKKAAAAAATASVDDDSPDVTLGVLLSRQRSLRTATAGAPAVPNAPTVAESTATSLRRRVSGLVSYVFGRRSPSPASSRTVGEVSATPPADTTPMHTANSDDDDVVSDAPSPAGGVAHWSRRRSYHGTTPT